MPKPYDHDAPRLAAVAYSKSRPLPNLPEHRAKLSFDTDITPTATQTASTGALGYPHQQADKPAANPLGITVNTNVSRHNGETPQQVFPDSSRKTEKTTHGKSPTTFATSKFACPGRNDKIKQLRLRGITGQNASKSLGFVPASSERPGQKTFLQRNRNVSDPTKTPTPRILITPTEGPPHAPSPNSADDELTPTPPPVETTTALEADIAPSASLVKRPPLFSLSSTRGGENKAAAWPIQNDDSSVSDKSFVTSPEFAADAGSRALGSQSIDQPRRVSQETILPTPNRSSGWWNYISSPFSAFSYGTPKTARSFTSVYPEDDSMPAIPIMADAAPMAVNEPENCGEAAEYYDPNISFDTPRQDGDLSAYPGSETPSAGSYSGARELSLEEDEKHVAGAAVAQNSAKPHQPDSNLYLSPRMDDSLARTREFDPPQRGFGSYKRYEVDSPTSPSPILGIASVSQFKSLRGPDSGEQSEHIKLVTHTPNHKAISPHPPSSISMTPPAPANESKHEPPPLPPPPASMPRQYSPPPSPTFQDKSILPLSSSREKSRWATASDEEAGYQSKTSSKRDYLFIGLASILSILVASSVILALFIRPFNDRIPIEAQWLNLTGFPPIPTGISTVAKPEAVEGVSGCVQQSMMWSCHLPKQDGSMRSLGQKDRPNFRFEIWFDSSKITNSSETQLATRSFRHTSPAAFARNAIRTAVNKAKRSIPPMFKLPEPASPSGQDRVFLGNTTDAVAQPFGGEETPFFITFLSLTPPPRHSLSKRQSSSLTSLSNLTSRIPAPIRDPNTGALLPGSLYPLPASQPLRLYNRGLATEHYAFYNYFDKSIFLAAPTSSTTAPAPSSIILNATNSAGGVPMSAANTYCIFSQTRYFVQIWTRQTNAALIGPPASTPQNATRFYTMPNGTLSVDNPIPDAQTASSAFDFTTPGSFPLPVTITVDRHGGRAEEKGVYCYGLDGKGDVISGAKVVVQEDRGFLGSIVNEAAPFQSVDLEKKGWEGIDGGSGGCKCQWKNWS